MLIFCCCYAHKCVTCGCLIVHSVLDIYDIFFFFYLFYRFSFVYFSLAFCLVDLAINSEILYFSGENGFFWMEFSVHSFEYNVVEFHARFNKRNNNSLAVYFCSNSLCCAFRCWCFCGSIFLAIARQFFFLVFFSFHFVC